MEVIEKRAAPEAYAEMEALIDRGVFPRGVSIWRSSTLSTARVGLPPEYWERQITGRGFDLDQDWTYFDIPEDEPVPALRRVLAPVEWNA